MRTAGPSLLGFGMQCCIAEPLLRAETMRAVSERYAGAWRNSWHHLQVWQLLGCQCSNAPAMADSSLPFMPPLQALGL